MHRRRFPGGYGLSFVVVFAVFVTPFLLAAESIPSEQFERLHALIKPKAVEEKWAQIPWLASLWEARQRAAREGKPILLWEMDGHPLGCV